jgi:hypothetical protein
MLVPRLASDHDLPTYPVAGMTGAYYHAQIVC